MLRLRVRAEHAAEAVEVARGLGVALRDGHVEGEYIRFDCVGEPSALTRLLDHVFDAAQRGAWVLTGSRAREHARELAEIAVQCGGVAVGINEVACTRLRVWGDAAVDAVGRCISGERVGFSAEHGEA